MKWGSGKLGMMTLRNATKMSEPWLGKLGNYVKVNKDSNTFISQTMGALLQQESSPKVFYTNICCTKHIEYLRAIHESNITYSSQVSRILSNAKHRPRRLYPVLYKPFLHQLHKISNNVCSSYLGIYNHNALQLPNFHKQLLRIFTKLGRIKPKEILKGKLLVRRPMKVISEG